MDPDTEACEVQELTNDLCLKLLCVMEEVMNIKDFVKQPDYQRPEGQKKVRVKRDGHLRGVTQHRRTTRWEAHIWEMRRQIYLGGYMHEDKAAKAHDILAIRCRGPDTVLNYELVTYTKLVPLLPRFSKLVVLEVLLVYSRDHLRGVPPVIREHDFRHQPFQNPFRPLEDQGAKAAAPAERAGLRARKPPKDRSPQSHGKASQDMVEAAEQLAALGGGAPRVSDQAEDVDGGEQMAEGRQAGEGSQSDDAKQTGSAEQTDDAKQTGEAKQLGDGKQSVDVMQTGDAKQTCDAKRTGDAKQTPPAKRTGNAKQTGRVKQTGDAKQAGNAKQSSPAKDTGNAKETGDAKQTGNTEQSSPAKQMGVVKQTGDAKHMGDAKQIVDAKQMGDAKQTGVVQQTGDAKQTGVVKQMGDVNQTGVVKQTGDGKQSDDAKQTGDAKRKLDAHQTGDVKQAGNAQQAGDAKRTCNAKQTPHVQQTIETKQPGDAKQIGETKQPPHAQHTIETKQTGEAKQTGNAKQTPPAQQTGDSRQMGTGGQKGDTKQVEPLSNNSGIQNGSWGGYDRQTVEPARNPKLTAAVGKAEPTQKRKVPLDSDEDNALPTRQSKRVRARRAIDPSEQTRSTEETPHYPSPSPRVAANEREARKPQTKGGRPQPSNVYQRNTQVPQVYGLPHLQQPAMGVPAYNYCSDYGGMSTTFNHMAAMYNWPSAGQQPMMMPPNTTGVFFRQSHSTGQLPHHPAQLPQLHMPQLPQPYTSQQHAIQLPQQHVPHLHMPQLPQQHVTQQHEPQQHVPRRKPSAHGTGVQGSQRSVMPGHDRLRELAHQAVGELRASDTAPTCDRCTKPLQVFGLEATQQQCTCKAHRSGNEDVYMHEARQHHGQGAVADAYAYIRPMQRDSSIQQTRKPHQDTRERDASQASAVSEDTLYPVVVPDTPVYGYVWGKIGMQGGWFPVYQPYQPAGCHG